MLSIDEKRDFLRAVPMFNSLSEEQLAQLAELCDDLTYQAGEDIFKQAEFLKRRLLNDSQPVVVVYSITEAGEEAGDIFLQGTNV